MPILQSAILANMNNTDQLQPLHSAWETLQAGPWAAALRPLAQSLPLDTSHPQALFHQAGAELHFHSFQGGPHEKQLGPDPGKQP